MKTRLIFSLFAFGLGAMIVSISILTSSGVSAENLAMTDKRMYVGEVMPDHALYPLLMAMDRFYLEISDPLERVHKQLEYASRRLYYSKELLKSTDPKKQELAFSTLTKAEKYILQAAIEFRELENPPESVHELMIRSLKYHANELEQLKAAFPDHRRPSLDELRQQQLAVLQELVANN